MNCEALGLSAAGSLLIPSAVLASSFLGSLHCVGMCGGLLAAVCKRPAEIVAYHGGRLISYVSLGSIFGWLGQALHMQQLPWLNRVSGLVMGSILIAMGWQFRNYGTLHLSLPKRLLGLTNRLSRALLAAKPNSQSLLIPISMGLLSAFLPCGWLYSYAVAAAALQNPWHGAGLMAMFWLGGLPALSTSALLVRKLLQPTQTRFPNVIAYGLMALGIWTILQKFATSIKTYSPP
mgnify:CR=1 FL=1